MKTSIIPGCLLMLLGLLACNKHDFNYPPGKVGISTIVYFPSVTTKGNKLVIINQGQSYTDSGANAVLNNAPVQYTTSGAVNSNVPGIYTLNYTAKNQQGYSASDFRTVVVIGNDVSANDFSGAYLRTATGVTSTWTKTANGVYTVDNPGGAGVGAGYLVTAVNYTGDSIAIPLQIATDPSNNTGQVSSSRTVMNVAANPPKYTWIFYASGYGTGSRTFVKQ